MGRLTGCSAHKEIKVSSSSKCAVAHCDLFNSNGVSITDACKTGITVVELDGLRCDGGSVSFLLWFTHKNQSIFSVMGDHPQDVGYGSQNRGFLEISVKLIHGYSRIILRESIKTSHTEKTDNNSCCHV